MRSFVGKSVVFITTKNIDYIRNVQEIQILEKEATRLKIIYSKKRSYILRVTEIWWKLFLLNNNFDVVFIGFAPQLILPFFYKFKNKEVVIDFFISVYDTLVNDRKKLSSGNPIAKLCHWLDSYVIKKADTVITDTKADAEYFIREFQGTKDKFETMYLEADKTIYYPREQQKRPDLLDKYVVLYFGSILPLQGVDVVLEAVKLMKAVKDIYFQIIGPIPSKYEKPIQDNVEYINWLNQTELAEHIANADLCLAGHFSRDIDKAKRTIPGKAYIYDAMQKKMILGDNAANHELFSKTKSNVYFVEMGNEKKVVEIISNIANQGRV